MGGIALLRSRVARDWLVLTAATGLLAACGKQGSGGGADKVVASAGEIKVTLADYQGSWDRITATYRPDISTLEGKRSFANDLVNRNILLDEAYKLGGITDPKVEAAIQKSRSNQMLQLLYRNEIESKVDVLGRDVTELYEKRKINVKASHILLGDVETAKRVRDEIVSGKTTFEAAAKKYSMDRSTREAGGALPELLWGRSIPKFQALAFEMEPGVVSEPVETEIGIHLIRVNERVAKELADIETLRPQLRTDMRKQLEAVRLNEFVAATEAKFALQWNDDALGVLDELIATEAALDIDTIPPAEHYIPDATPEQRAMTLASWTGGTWTIGDYVDYITEQPPMNRPIRLPKHGLKEYIRAVQLREKILMLEAAERGYDKDPEVEKAEIRIREQILVNLVHSRFMQAADVTEADARALYDSTMTANAQALTLPERVDMLVLVHQDPAQVREGLRRIGKGEPEAQVIGEISADMRTRMKGGRTGLIARGTYAPQLEVEAFSGRVGKGWSQVIETESGSGSVKVLAQEPERLATFEETKDTLMQQLAAARGEKAFEEWLQGRRSELGVEIHDDVLELIGKPVS
jgi:parvulin-like peptidyl-prolyl isomerase